MAEISSETWEAILQSVKTEFDVTDVAFRTWLQPLKVHDVRNNTVVILVTTSSKPVCSAEFFKKGAVISAVGAYTYDMQELDPAVFDKCSKIYFDSEEAVLSESGDILRPLDAGTLSKEQFTGDIGDYLLGRIPGRESADEIIVFENVGIGALDLYTAQKVYEKAAAAGVGTTWE